ncbi:MAG: metallophosphoesterase [Bacteroidetes bacterium]|nr:metallophosphoesterase [Bacteroidota bacterium]
MKKFTLFFLLGILLFAGSQSLIAQPDTLTILHFNDTHSNLAPLGPRNQDLSGTRGGMARAATLIGMTKMTEPNVLTLHAGDVFIGDLFFNVYYGAASFQLMNALGFDAMTLGNHEFDLQPTTLEQALAASFAPDSGFSILSANLFIPPDTLQTLAGYVAPFTIKQAGNIKVGIFGMTTPSTNVLSMPAPAVIDTNIIDVVISMVDTLAKQNCDVIVMLSHLGFYLDQTVAENIPGINVIVSGHDHFLFDQPLEVKNPLNKNTWIVQTGAFNQFVGKMQLSVENDTVDLLQYQAIPLDGNVPEEPTVKAQVDGMIAEIEAVYGALYSQQIGTLTKTYNEFADSLTEDGEHDTPVGNLVSDAFRLTMGTDIGIEPGGSTAQPLYEGPIVPADIFRTVGYGFNTVNGLGYRIVTFDIVGADLYAGLEFGLTESSPIAFELSSNSGMGPYPSPPILIDFTSLLFTNSVRLDMLNSTVIYLPNLLLTLMFFVAVN